MKTQYSNQQLASHYHILALIQKPYTHPRDYKETIMIIDQSEIDIAQFYAEQGNLKALRVKGMGKPTKNLLELILEHGIDEAKRILHEREDKKLESKGRRTKGDLSKQIFVRSDGKKRSH